MTIQEFIQQLKETPQQVEFAKTLEVIADHYNYKAGTFFNGSIENSAGTNEGSCKIFAFAKLNDLSRDEALACFGHHYYDVLKNPNGTDHANIRQFMETGWSGIRFEGHAWEILS